LKIKQIWSCVNVRNVYVLSMNLGGYVTARGKDRLDHLQIVIFNSLIQRCPPLQWSTNLQTALVQEYVNTSYGPGSLYVASPSQAERLARPTPFEHRGIADARLWLTFATHAPAVSLTPRSGVVAVAGCKGTSGTAVREPE